MRRFVATSCGSRALICTSINSAVTSGACATQADTGTYLNKASKPQVLRQLLNKEPQRSRIVEPKVILRLGHRTKNVFTMWFRNQKPKPSSDTKSRNQEPRRPRIPKARSQMPKKSFLNHRSKSEKGLFCLSSEPIDQTVDMRPSAPGAVRLALTIMTLAIASVEGTEDVCDTVEAGRCTMDAHKDFPAAVTSQKKERCDDVVRTYMDCVTEKCKDVKDVRELKEKFEEACSAMAQMEGRITAKGTGAGLRHLCRTLRNLVPSLQNPFPVPSRGIRFEGGYCRVVQHSQGGRVHDGGSQVVQ